MDYRGGYLELLAECSGLNAKNKMLLAALEQTLSTLDAICEMEGFDKHVQHGSREAREAISKVKGGE